ncbi:MAG: endolytic transglycosylase MltG [Anaerolineales bacterium]|nr:endolytic transglycosylase MltG [Anaerolineales bacterium]MCK5635008.1 endolytic transglycosylase MltG [Anaerolineales bacterium]
MPKLVKSCLFVFVLAVFGVVICVGVWIAGAAVFGLPTIPASVGEPDPSLTQVQETALGLYLLLNQNSLDTQAGPAGTAIDLTVEEGDTATVVIQRLNQAGILEQPNVLRFYLRYRGLDRGIDAGLYNLRGDMTIREIAEALQSSQPVQNTITIPEGWRREQIAQLLSGLDLGIGEIEFLEVTLTPPQNYIRTYEMPTSSTLEGFLFPDTYLIDPDSSAQDFVFTLLANFENRLDTEIHQGFTNQDLTVFEGVILASIVEREAVLPKERTRIAAVFLNRIKLGMALEADPTVQFALGAQPDGTWWKLALTYDDLEIDSPYNTYRYAGLPLGPIANPGLESLKAVAFPDQTNELYFRTLCDGSGGHAFAVTFDEHLNNACP